MVAVIIGGAILGALSERYSLPFIPNYRDAAALATGTDDQMEQIALARAKGILISEEGRRNDVYLDKMGLATVGIGHRVLAGDGLSVGQRISDAQVQSFFDSDIASAFNAALKQAKEIDKYNADMIARLTSVNFQLGTGWRTKFPNTWSALKSGNANLAINNLLQSDWRKQTPNRVVAFVETIRNQFA